MSERIRWNDGDEITGSTGVLGPLTFRIVRVYLDAKWMLLAHGIGMDSRQGRSYERDELKAEAERWLEEFVSSLGVIFPDPELPECHRCEKPITGTPVTDPDDPLGRQFCSEECADASAEAAYEQQYRPGVAT